MSRVKLHLLGAPRIELDGEPIEVDTRKAIALAAYLVLTAQPQARDRLAATFWPEADDSKAHAALRRTLSVLNKALDGVGLIIERETVTLTGGPDVWVDVQAFRTALAECAGHGHAATDICPRCRQPLTQAAELYRGDFLSGFNLRDSSEFDDWQFFQSETLRRELAGALERLVACHLQANEPEAALPVARRWLALDPIHEPAHRQLMRLYAQTNQRAAALRQYQECLRVLNAELGVPPLPETTALFEAIKENRLAPEIPIPKIPNPHSAPPSLQSPVSGPVPLIGRAAEWHTLLTAYASINKSGQLVVLEGEAGIGKTRLADAFLDHARESQSNIATARCYEGELTLAYGAFVELLRSALRQPAWAARLTELDPHMLSEAARLLPELADSHPSLPPAPPLSSPGAQSRFFDSILQLLSGLSTDKPPVIFLDDVQWMDEASLDLLTYLVRRLPTTRLFILLTWRGQGAEVPPRLRQLLADSQRAGTGQSLALGRLSEAEVIELVERAVGGNERASFNTFKTLDEGLVRRLFDETEGLPLFVVEYLAALQHDSDWSLPVGVRGLLQSRLGTVSEAGRQLLSAAAVIGRSFDLETLQEASGRSPDETVAGLEALVSLGLVREVGEADGSLRYDFSHDKLRALVYDETSLARRRLLHRRTAEVLSSRGRVGPGGPLASGIAQHYRLSGHNPQAAHYYKLAGDHARALYANADALAHYGSALALGYDNAAALHQAIGDLQTLRGEYGAALKSYESAAAQTSGASADALAALEHKLGLVYERRGDAQLAERHFEAALAAYGEAEAAARARVLADWSLSAHHTGQAGQAQALAEQALTLAESGGDAHALAQSHNILGILAASREAYAEAQHHLKQSLVLAEGLHDVGGQVAALNNLALGSRASDDLNEAIALTQRALALCAAQGDRHRQAALHNNLADLLHSAGRGDEAMTHLKQAVALFAEIGSDTGEAQWQPEIWKLTEW